MLACYTSNNASSVRKPYVCLHWQIRKIPKSVCLGPQKLRLSVVGNNAAANRTQNKKKN
jgi:hypothetical protein